MLAGLFNGTPIVSKAKEDIVVDGVPIQLKPQNQVVLLIVVL
jgi:hypothetical protein